MGKTIRGFMYKFEASFTTLADLVAFTNTLGVGQVNKIAEVRNTPVEFHAEKPPVIEAKVEPKAPKAKKEKVEAPVKEEMIEVESPFAKQAPAEEPAFDRASALAKATELVGKLKASGIADGDLMPKIHEVYAIAGCPVNLKIGQFDDAALSRFIPLFEQKVASIVGAPSASFI
jgi:hypothetical protein